MIDVKTAQKLVFQNSSTTFETMEVEPQDALNYVLAKNVFSTIDMPPFRQAAMDGYAVNMCDGSSYTVVGEVKAGDNNSPNLQVGEAVRIFTGAPVPHTANAVIMQERTTSNTNRIMVEPPVTPQMNIRPKGEQIKIGDIALTKGTTIKSAHIAFLASLGITKITVFKKPSIAIVITGTELVAPGNPLPYGKIYESNGAMLLAVLDELGYKKTSIVTIADDYENTKSVLLKTIKNYDVVIATGGISVGDYDFVGKALNEIGVQEIFYKVKQKPGKPLFFGKKDDVPIFGLPGNPAAALTCFYVYVYPFLRKSEGSLKSDLTNISMPILKDFSKKGNRAQFLKASLGEGGVEVLSEQSSAMIRAFGDANALVFIPENTTKVSKGELVKTLLLPTK